jgi:hypothetical protein
MKTFRKLWCLTALLATAMFFLAGFDSTTVSATNTPQALPFSQNWGNTGLITANDDWSGVPGVVGFLGDFDAGATTAVDPRTLLTPFAINAVDVIANQTSVAITNGGVAEFDGIANAVVALNGSGTADAPHIIVYLNTTGTQWDPVCLQHSGHRRYRRQFDTAGRCSIPGRWCRELCLGARRLYRRCFIGAQHDYVYAPQPQSSRRGQ